MHLGYLFDAFHFYDITILFGFVFVTRRTLLNEAVFKRSMVKGRVAASLVMFLQTFDYLLKWIQY